MRVSQTNRSAASLAAALMMVSLSIASDDQGSRPVPNVGRSRWTYQGLGRFQGSGLLAGYPRHLEALGSRQLSRYEMAVAYHAVAVNLETFMADTEAASARLSTEDPASKQTDQDRQEARERIDYLHKWQKDGSMTYLTRASREFTPELKTLGVPDHYLDSVVKKLGMESAKLQLPPARTVVQQFRDVPAGHWAAQAVLDLRRLGILDGYPDGDFHGD